MKSKTNCAAFTVLQGDKMRLFRGKRLSENIYKCEQKGWKKLYQVGLMWVAFLSRAYIHTEHGRCCSQHTYRSFYLVCTWATICWASTGTVGPSRPDLTSHFNKWIAYDLGEAFIAIICLRFLSLAIYFPGPPEHVRVRAAIPELA